MSPSSFSNGDDVVYPSAIPFVLVHLACIGVIWSGITWEALTICVALYWLRIFAIGAGYHRYFSHRAYSNIRVFQFLLALAAQSTAQKSVLWWAAMHRHHHLHSDTEDDTHSPRHQGFFYSHIGWIFARRNDTADLGKVADLARFPELRLLHKFELLPALALAALCFLAAGWSGLVVGFLWSTVFVYHATFCINSLAHVSGSARYVTGDDSRNNWLLALFTMGGGWHNNQICLLPMDWDGTSPNAPKRIDKHNHRFRGRTDVCLQATVMGAIDWGFRTILATDALCSSSDEAHDALMEFYRGRLGEQLETATVENILRHWR